MKPAIKFVLAGVKFLLSPFIHVWKWFWYGNGHFGCPGWAWTLFFILFLISLPYAIVLRIIEKRRPIECYKSKK